MISPPQSDPRGFAEALMLTVLNQPPPRWLRIWLQSTRKQLVPHGSPPRRFRRRVAYWLKTLDERSANVATILRQRLSHRHLPVLTELARPRERFPV